MGNSDSDLVVDTCRSLMKMTQREDADLQQLSAEIASQNEILQAVLRRVNSLENGLEFEVEDPTHATAILGRRKLGEVLRRVISNHQQIKDISPVADQLATSFQAGLAKDSEVSHPGDSDEIPITPSGASTPDSRDPDGGSVADSNSVSEESRRTDDPSSTRYSTIAPIPSSQFISSKVKGPFPS